MLLPHHRCRCGESRTPDPDLAGSGLGADSLSSPRCAGWLTHACADQPARRHQGQHPRGGRNGSRVTGEATRLGSHSLPAPGPLFVVSCVSVLTRRSPVPSSSVLSPAPPPRQSVSDLVLPFAGSQALHPVPEPQGDQVHALGRPAAPRHGPCDCCVRSALLCAPHRIASPLGGAVLRRKCPNLARGMAAWAGDRDD